MDEISEKYSFKQTKTVTISYDYNNQQLTIPDGPNSQTNKNLVSEYHLNILIPTILVIIGWRFLYLNAKKLATRSETKSSIDSVVSIMEEIDKLAITFWLSISKDNQVEHEKY